MPAWEKFLKEEEMWDVILFLYDFTGQRPSRPGGGRGTMTSAAALRGCLAVLIAGRARVSLS